MSKLKWVRLNLHPFCGYCSKPVTFETSVLDHDIPRSRGGSNSSYNRVLACIDCDIKKGNLTGFEFRAGTYSHPRLQVNPRKQKQRDDFMVRELAALDKINRMIGCGLVPRH